MEWQNASVLLETIHKKSIHSSGGNFQSIKFLNSLWFQILWHWFCFLIFEVNWLLFSSLLSHIPFKLVVRILLSGMVPVGQSSFWTEDSKPVFAKLQSVPLRQRPKLLTSFVCCHHILNLYLSFASNTTTEMTFTSKRDELSFCVKRLSCRVDGLYHKPSVC